MRIRSVVVAFIAVMLAGCSEWASEQPLIPQAERDPVGLSGTYQSDTDWVRITPIADTLYLMQDAEPDANLEDVSNEPSEVAFDLLRSRVPRDDTGDAEPVRDYLLQVRRVDDLGDVSYFYTIVTLTGPADANSGSFVRFDMLCADATRAFAARAEDGFCIFDDYVKLRAAAFDALVWYDDARMAVEETTFSRVDLAEPDGTPSPRP